MASELDEVIEPLKCEIMRSFPPQMQTTRNQEWLAELDHPDVIELVRTHPTLTNKPHLQNKADEVERQIALHIYGDVHVTIHNHYNNEPTGYSSHSSYPPYNPPPQLPGYSHQHYDPSPTVINFSPHINVEGSEANSKSSQDNSGNAHLGLLVLFILAFLLVLVASN